MLCLQGQDFGTKLGISGLSVRGSGCRRHGSPGSLVFRSYRGHGSLAPFAGSGRLPINTTGTIVIEILLAND